MPEGKTPERLLMSPKLRAAGEGLKTRYFTHTALAAIYNALDKLN